ncbi:MAG: 3-hydroxyacyl-CoA dehydrogenase family protein [Acidimicrobiia bacterium]
MNDAVVVVGGGTMGAGIAQSMLEAGASVVLVEADSTRLDAARGRVTDGLRRRFKSEADPDAACRPLLDRLRVVDRMEPNVEPALVVEAVPEDAALKRAVLGDVERTFGAVPLVATNTSSLSIDALAGSLTRPERFIGMHFFNPVPRSVLVELVAGSATTPQAVEAAREWVGRLEKECIVVKDSPGFATSRLGVCIGLEAIRMVEEGVASPTDIDQGMVLGYKFPIGPLRLTDVVGLDVRLGIAEHLAKELGPRFEPPQLLRDMVGAGDLGQKSGKGFYEWR